MAKQTGKESCWGHPSLGKTQKAEAEKRGEENLLGEKKIWPSKNPIKKGGESLAGRAGVSMAGVIVKGPRV